MRIQTSVKLADFIDSKLQVLTEEKQKHIIAAILVELVKHFITIEFKHLEEEYIAFENVGKWRKSAYQRVLSFVMLYHLQHALLSFSQEIELTDEIKDVLHSYHLPLFLEILEGFLSNFQYQLETFSITREDQMNAAKKYGIKTEDGGYILYDTSITDYISEKIRSQQPRYTKRFKAQDDLEEAASKIPFYRGAEAQQGAINAQLSSGLLGQIKQIRRNGNYWQTHTQQEILTKLARYQQNNAPNFAQRPLSQLVIAVRDNIGLLAKQSVISSPQLKTFFGEFLRILEEEVVDFLYQEDLLTDHKELKPEISQEVIHNAFLQITLSSPHSLQTRTLESLVVLKNGVKNWKVFFSLPGMKIDENTEQVPELRGVTFLNPNEAQDFLNEYLDTPDDTEKNRVKYQFVAEAAALVQPIEAFDFNQAANIAYRTLRSTLDWLFFTYRHGSYCNPELQNIDVCCVELQTMKAFRISHFRYGQMGAKLEIRHPNLIEGQKAVMEELQTLWHKVETRNPLAERVDKAIYWHSKAQRSISTEEQLLNYWISLESLIGYPDKEENLRNLMPFRAGLLAPTEILVSQKFTYAQLRTWTGEVVDKVYTLRNEIMHGGTIEGPSFEMFVERFGRIVREAILTVLFTLLSRVAVPHNLEELLTWIWYKNPDNSMVDTL